jgi:hypothetical protein
MGVTVRPKRGQEMLRICKKNSKEFLNLIDYKFISVFTQLGPAN